MLTLQVVNLSGGTFPDAVSDYRYTVYINRDVIATGSVKNHMRASGWASLVKQIAEEHIAAGFVGAHAWNVKPEDLAPDTVTACGKVRPDGAVCVTPLRSGIRHKVHKFVKVKPA